MIISVAQDKDTLSIVSYDGAMDEVSCISSFNLDQHTKAEIWDKLFDYCANRLQQLHKIDKLVFLQCSRIDVTAELRGLLIAVASELQIPLVQVQFVDDYTEKDAWQALPDTAIGTPTKALALGAVFMATQGMGAIIE